MPNEVPLNPGEVAALQVGCPLDFCMQPKHKRCVNKHGDKTARPHKARIQQARDVAATESRHSSYPYLKRVDKEAVRTRRPLRSGAVTDRGIQPLTAM